MTPRPTAPVAPARRPGRLAAAPAAALLAAACSTAACWAAELGPVRRYHVLELDFAGPTLGPKDTPARDVQLEVTFRHEAGREVRVGGFWDGDGRGGAVGGVFRVRFCPTQPGRWRIAKVRSNRPDLAGRHEGEVFTCLPGKHPGFWIADGRWYRRSDGSHPFIIGNTHYTFLSGLSDRGPTGSDPAADIRANAQYFRKVRFALGGGRYPDPTCPPFFDDAGRGTEDGRFALRPNPAWFRRADAAVRAGFQADIICDLICCGPDTRQIRSTLKGDPAPYLRYLAARFGAFPNVWFCLCNEWDIKDPSYSPAEIVHAGSLLRAALPYPTPISVHGRPADWNRHLNAGRWHDHVIIQRKLRTLDRAADAATRNAPLGGNVPVCNDENAYEGAGDRFSEADVIEGCLGTVLGGGYPTTGCKPAAKKGQYFWGRFDPARHHAADNLRALRRYLDANTPFWRMEPTAPAKLLANPPRAARMLAEPGREYLLGTRAVARLRADLPPGRWRIVQLDLIALREKTLAQAASGTFRFAVPASRAVLTHFRKLP